MQACRDGQRRPGSRTCAAGLARHQFLLDYQPQVGRDGRMIGVEALLRWQHPRARHGAAGGVHPAAEETSLILPIGHWVLETACAQLAAWERRPDRRHLSIAVNVSVRQFRHPEFVDEVMAALKETKVSPHKLKLELTESLLADGHGRSPSPRWPGSRKWA
jgi:EAL domain-containing protein (putative c-di-GMP-specific phosphodiesterase class I)